MGVASGPKLGLGMVLSIIALWAGPFHCARIRCLFVLVLMRGWPFKTRQTAKSTSRNVAEWEFLLHVIQRRLCLGTPGSPSLHL